MNEKVERKTCLRVQAKETEFFTKSRNFRTDQNAKPWFKHTLKNLKSLH